jgi:hypothetical protein
VNEEELRAMVRESIARHVGAGSVRLPPPENGFGETGKPDTAYDPLYVAHASFVRLPVLSGGDDGGACLIEPAVRCNHCGYCQSFGH